MFIDKSLLSEMQKVSKSLAVLVIDEQRYTTEMIGTMAPGDPKRTNFTPIKDVYSAQQKVLMLAQKYNCPIFLIKMDYDIPVGRVSYDEVKISDDVYATKVALRALLPINTITINKHTCNSFIGTGLFEILSSQYQNCGVENLVVMGWESNLCVPATIGIALEILRDKVKVAKGEGAADYAMTVLTCQAILNGRTAQWGDIYDGIRFYSHL
ncbi:MAG: isochorismatase family protein [Psychromonas sp.]|nr:isochorismatase family protein [Psychromonas sp.]